MRGVCAFKQSHNSLCMYLSSIPPSIPPFLHPFLHSSIHPSIPPSLQFTQRDRCSELEELLRGRENTIQKLNEKVVSHDVAIIYECNKYLYLDVVVVIVVVVIVVVVVVVVGVVVGTVFYSSR